jgi:protein-arginine kinase activator protein McsA
MVLLEMSSLKEKAKTFGTYHVECDHCGYKDTVQQWMHYCPKCQWLIKCWEEKWVRLEDAQKEIEEIHRKYEGLISKAEKDCADCYQELKQKLQQFKRSLEIQLGVLKSKPHHSETETQLEIMLNEFKEKFEELLKEVEKK